MVSWTVGHFSTLEVTYGSLSTVAAFLLWLWVSAFIVLAGAELDMAICHETRLYGAGGIGRRGTVEGSPGIDGTP